MTADLGKLDRTSHVYLIEAIPCGRTPFAKACMDGPKCAGCLTNGERLVLDERVEVIETQPGKADRKMGARVWRTR